MTKYEYSESGIEWIGTIPKHWNVDRLKDISSINYAVLDSSTPSDYVMKYIDISIVNEKGIISIDTIEEIEYEQAPSRARRKIAKEDIIVSSVRPNLQAIAQITFDEPNYICSTGLNVVKPNIKYTLSKFLYLYILSPYSKNYFESTAKGVGYPAISDKDFNTLLVLIPHLPEQLAIANYLDKACADIDRAVDVKRKQIENLQLQLKSIVHQVVTKGLNPYVELVESGIDWIGKYPRHWKKQRLKWFFRLSRGFDLEKSNFIDGNIPVYGSNGCIGYHNQYTTKGPGITVGRSGSVGEVNFIETDFWAHNTCLFVEYNYGNVWKFIFYFLKSYDIKMFGSGSVVGTLNRNYIHRETIVYPSPTEQGEIAMFLDRKVEQIEAVQSIIEKQIDTLLKYKKSLIHEVVTGKKQVYDQQ